MKDFKLLYILLALVLLQSCYKDKGHYDLHPINAITIKDNASGSLIAVEVGDTIKLAPQILQTMPVEEKELEYEWSVYDNSPNSPYNLPNTVIDSTRNLSYVVKGAPFTLGQRYRLTYKVTDKTTGVSSFLLYQLLISNSFREGWLLLEDVDGTTDMSIILPNDTVVHHLYTSTNAAAPLGKPLRLELTPFGVTDDLSASGKRMYIVAEGGAVELNYLTFEKLFDYPQLFFKAPVPADPEYINWRGYLYGSRQYGGDGIIIDDGKIHYNLVGGFPGAKYWGAELLAPGVNLDYRIFPFVAGGINYNSAYSMVVYDNKNQRFYAVSSTALNAFPASASNSLFDMNNTGLEMIYMDSSNVLGEYNTIMNGAGTPYYLRFSTDATTAAPVITLAKATIADAKILQASSWTSSTITPHIYYSIDNHIYRYETTSNTVASIFSFPSGESITKLLYRKGIPGSQSPYLLAATWNGSEGKLYLFPVTATGNLSNYTKHYSGFNKIVDISYKLP